MNKPQQRIAALLHALNENVYEKEHVLALSLLSALAGESIFLLGPPGVAKSMIARRLKLAFQKADSFEYLMSRFSTPDEIFGPVSISKLKDEDTYERVVDGYLPTANIVFLDEIWKAGPAIQNALLTILNEKVYRNGRDMLRVPLKGLIAASNELPATGQGLEALFDRFLIRYVVNGVESRTEFEQMLESNDEKEPVINPELSIADVEYDRWQKMICSVNIHASVFMVIHALREEIDQHNQRLLNDGSVEASLYVSDRRWKKWMKILRTSAFFNNSDTIHLSDCLLLMHGLWNEVDQLPVVEQMVYEAVRKAVDSTLLGMQQIKDDLDDLKQKLSSFHAVSEAFDPGLELIDSYYHRVEGVRMRERLLIFASDYQQLDQTGQLFYLHKDKYKANCCMLKKYDPLLNAKVPRTQIYRIKRGRRSLYINDHEYPLSSYPEVPFLPEPEEPEDLQPKFQEVRQKIDQIRQSWDGLLQQEMDYMENHLFLNHKEKDKFRELLLTQKSHVEQYHVEDRKSVV